MMRLRHASAWFKFFAMLVTIGVVASLQPGCAGGDLFETRCAEQNYPNEQCQSDDDCLIDGTRCLDVGGPPHLSRLCTATCTSDADCSIGGATGTCETWFNGLYCLRFVCDE